MSGSAASALLTVFGSVLFFIALPFLFTVESPRPRFAWSNDGNYHDKDDIGASAMMQALMWRAGARNHIAYVEHSSHIGENSSSQHANMVESVTGHAHEFLIPVNRIYDQVMDPIGSAQALAIQIDICTPGRLLIFFQSGPWESMARGFDLADPAKHQYVKIISHSNWNDNHESQSSHRNRYDFFDQYDPGGVFDGYVAPDFERIDDQNGYAFRTNGLSNWAWLNMDHDLTFVYDRTVASGSAQGDMSDAGMVFWYLTGIEHPTMQDIKDFLL